MPRFEDGHYWFISLWSGSLLKSKYPPPYSAGDVSKRVGDALSCCEAPFSCHWSPVHQHLPIASTDEPRLLKMNERLFWLGNRRFLPSLIYARRNAGIFNHTRAAYSAVAELPGHKDGRSDRCLQRSLLAAKTSKSFPRSGVLLIGAEFSTCEMHAWIIEDEAQPDSDDRSWINYRPLLAWHY